MWNHMGYISGNLPDRGWLNYAIEHYLDELLSAGCGAAACL